MFAGLALWAAGHDRLALWPALACLVGGFVVSYARARAEVEGWDASVGLFERTVHRRRSAGLRGAALVDLGLGGIVVGVWCWPTATEPWP